MYETAVARLGTLSGPTFAAMVSSSASTESPENTRDNSNRRDGQSSDDGISRGAKSRWSIVPEDYHHVPELSE